MKKKFDFDKSGYFQEQPETEGEGTQEKSSSSKGLADGLTRYTMIVSASKLSTLKALAYEDRLSMKELCDDMINAYITAQGAAKVKRAEKNYKNKR